MIAAGVVFMIFEILFGALTGLDVFFLGVGFVIGGVVLMSGGAVEFSLVTVGIFFLFYTVYLRTPYKKTFLVFLQKAGLDCIVGKYGIACTNITSFKTGEVVVDGELWIAKSAESIKSGAKIVVIEYTSGLLVIAKPSPPAL
ncbi:MAG: NfeD family protein [Patescibacteria group bacterium]